MIERYVSPSEFKRLISALLAVVGLIAIAALFGFLIVPGLRNVNEGGAESAVMAVQGETGWLDPTDYPSAVRTVIPPIDPATVMTPNPALMSRGKAIYAQTCATCHGPEGKGDGPGAKGLNPIPRNFTQPAGWKNGTRIEDIYKTLEEGIKGSSMVSYNDLSKRDRMALAHVVQSLGAFDHGASEPKARQALEKLFASAGEVIPSRIPVPKAMDLLRKEFAVAPALARIEDPVLVEALADPKLAAQTLAGLPGWRDSEQALAKGVVAGLPGNGFHPAVATYGAGEWKALRAALLAR